jgi:hypothetical protein
MVLHCMAAAGMQDKSRRHPRIEVHDTGVSSPRRLSVTLTPLPSEVLICILGSNMVPRDGDYTYTQLL